MKKLVFWTLFAFLSSGFQVLMEATWEINEEDPTVWIKFCDEIKDQSFRMSELPTDDPLRSTSVTFDNVSQSVIDDFNVVGASFLRLALYPDDPDNPGTPAAGDSTFTKAKAAIRTMNICIESSNNPFEGGHASPEFEDGEYVGCTIVMAKSVKDDITSFISTLTHEIGHCAGLDHPQETVHAIMSYFHDPEEIRLMIDDKMGLVHLYPKDGYDLDEDPTFGLSCSFKN